MHTSAMFGASYGKSPSVSFKNRLLLLIKPHVGSKVFMDKEILSLLLVARYKEDVFV